MFTPQSKFRRGGVRAFVAVLALSVMACTAVYRNHGYVPLEEELAQIKVGVDTKASVVEAVGSPAASGVLTDQAYYYMSMRVRHYGAREPKVVDRQLLAISFNPSGTVKNIERFGLEDGRVVPLERRVTSSGVTDQGFLRQLLGNLGRVDPGSLLSE